MYNVKFTQKLLILVSIPAHLLSLSNTYTDTLAYTLYFQKGKQIEKPVWDLKH